MLCGLLKSANRALLKYPDPSTSWDTEYGVNGIVTVNLKSTPGNVFQQYENDKDYVFELSPTVARTGIIERSGVEGNGYPRSIKIIGGSWNLGGGLNYHIHAQAKKWIFIEGQEADLSNTENHADFISVSGGTLYEPNVFIQNCRATGLNATNSTNHADFYQPQGKVKYVYADKVTLSTNYDGYTIAADGSTGSQAPKGVTISRHNFWFSATNATNPITALYWINNGGNGGTDTAPFPLTFVGDTVYIDMTRGAGRTYNSFNIAAFFPNSEGSGSSGSEWFTAGEKIGGSTSSDTLGTYAYVPNAKMLVTGKVREGSPSVNKVDVSKDTDGRGSYVAAGIGTNYSSPGYALRGGVDFPV